MSVSSEQGFTITELVLVAAVTGLLIFGLMGGWIFSLNTQSYKDSARSLASSLEAQFTATTNVWNDRQGQQRCNTASKVIDEGGRDPRGTTSCVIMGRYVYVNGGGSGIPGQVESAPIVGFEEAGAGEGTTDKDIILSYNPIRVETTALQPEVEKIRWSTRIYTKGDQSKIYHHVFAIIRSPETGLIYTYSAERGGRADLPTVQEVINASNNTDEQTICLDPEAAVAGPRIGIIIGANAASASAVRMAADGSAGC